MLYVRSALLAEEGEEDKEQDADPGGNTSLSASGHKDVFTPVVETMNSPLMRRYASRHKYLG
jgi:hypothetical protein